MCSLPTQEKHDHTIRVGLQYNLDTTVCQLESIYGNLASDVHSDSYQENLLSEYNRIEEKLYVEKSAKIPQCGGPC